MRIASTIRVSLKRICWRSGRIIICKRGHDEEKEQGLPADRGVGRGESGAKYKDVKLADTKTYGRAAADDRLARLTEAAHLAIVFAHTGAAALINMNTVAAWKHGATLVLAANGVNLKNLDADQRASVIEASGARNMVITGDYSDPKVHAEMALVAYMDDRGVHKPGQKVGVSKACCRNCASSFEDEGIEYLVWHTR